MGAVENTAAEVDVADTAVTATEAEETRLSLEEMFSELEGVIGRMEGEELSLEKSFDLYNKGMELLKECSKSIDEVEKKVLALDEDGETYEF